MLKRRLALAALCFTLSVGPAWAGEDEHARALHVLERLGYGPRPHDLEQVETEGVERYIQSQLAPESIPEPAALTERLAALDTLKKTPAEIFDAYAPPRRTQDQDPKAYEQVRQAAKKRARVLLQQAMEARLARALGSPRQLQEVMTEFWYNHFNVYQDKGLDKLWIGAYEEQAIRPHAMGRFRDLVGAVAHHPAMLFYLDNWQNSAPGTPHAKGRFKGLNENFARELMELHTLGVDGGYTQADVIALARILTGWGFSRHPERDHGYGFYFDPKRHDHGDKVFLGQTIHGGGVEEGEQALDILARSPATARHLSYQLAQYFVADNPPESLVASLSATYLKSDGDLRSVLATLFHSPEFWAEANRGNKFKTPYQFVLSSVRATGGHVENYQPIARVLSQLGMPLYGCLTPDGYKNTQEAWLSPDAMARRISLAVKLASGRLPVVKGMDGPADAELLGATLGGVFSASTREAIAKAPPRLRASLILGSPEFMRH